jgi:hypothetical protein
MKLLLALCTLCLLGSVGTGVRGDDLITNRDNLNGGFFLLHDLLSNEHDVPLLTDLKTSPQEIQDFAKKVSLTAEDGKVALDKMRDSDSKISWDNNPLPKFEQDVRASIKGEKQHQLLFGTKDRDFVRAFLVSQAEASMYASNIAKVMAQEDNNPRHARELTRISDRWHALYEEDFRLMRNY